MKKTILIGKFNDEAKEIGNILSACCQVLPCSNEDSIIEEMLQSEKPDLIVFISTGSAIAARDRFDFLLPFGIPILGIGNAPDEAELFIHGLLSEDKARFLRRPVNIVDILIYAKELGGIGEEESTSGAPKDESACKTVLLVDDNAEFLRIMEAMISKRYKVRFATSAVQAFISISQNKPDIILLDYEMPVCNGRMILEMLRAEEDMKDIPVVFLTGMSDASYVSSVVSLHPEGYLLKPCDEDMVFSMIDTVLKGK